VLRDMLHGSARGCAQQTDSVARTAEPTAERTSSQKGLRSPVAMVMPAASRLAFSFACNKAITKEECVSWTPPLHSAHLGRRGYGSRGDNGVVRSRHCEMEDMSVFQ